jgi:two-component system, NarL family, sensor histidine kinase YdfH
LDLYKGNENILIFFIYGLAFFSLGISALQQRIGRSSTLPILDEVKYLGIFGIIHGITEWLIFVIISRMYPDLNNLLYIAVVALNSSSFFFLWIYGTRSIEYHGKYKKLFDKAPYITFILWSCIFGYYIFIYVMHGDFRLSIPKVLGRYILGFTSALITAMAFGRSARAMDNLKYKKISKNFKRLSILFMSYGVLAGLFVKKESFFPANIINNTLFKEVFHVPVEIVRASAAVLITIEFIKVMNRFRDEVNSKFDMLKERNIVSQERRKLGRELHDVIIQNLFASGLQIEGLLVDEEDEEKKKVLSDIKTGLNNGIFLIREFIAKVPKPKLDFYEFKFKLDELADRLKGRTSMKIKIKYGLPEVNLGTLSSDTLTQVYYIIQEAITNAIKHSQGDKVSVSLESTMKFLTVTIEDNGKGFTLSDLDDSKGYGIRSMKERTAICRGKLYIDSEAGTIITLNIPWEGQENGETC